MKCPLLRKIKTYIGVSLPWYISIPVIMLSIMFPIFFGCNTYENVGVILDRCFSFLAVLTFSNVYYIEIQQKTAEVYNLLPNRRKTADILKRLLVRFLFLTCMIGICFAGYSIKGLHVYVGQEAGTMLIQAFFSVVAVMFYVVATIIRICLEILQRYSKQHRRMQTGQSLFQRSCYRKEWHCHMIYYPKRNMITGNPHAVMRISHMKRVRVLSQWLMDS